MKEGIYTFCFLSLRLLQRDPETCASLALHKHTIGIQTTTTIETQACVRYYAFQAADIRPLAMLSYLVCACSRELAGSGWSSKELTVF